MENGGCIIARVWHGTVPREKAERYLDFLVERAVPDYKSVDGNLGVEIWTRDEGDTTHFIVISYWQSLEDVKKFAGEDYEKAKYYPEDRDYLLEFEPNVLHYCVAYSNRVRRGQEK